MKETIGDRLRKLRKAKGLTLEEAGKLANKTRQNIYKYEKNIITNIPSDTIAMLAKIYSSTPSYIMGWEEEETPSKEEATSFIQEVFNNLSEQDQKTVKELIYFLESKNKNN